MASSESPDDEHMDVAEWPAAASGLRGALIRRPRGRRLVIACDALRGRTQTFEVPAHYDSYDRFEGVLVAVVAEDDPAGRWL